MPLSERCPHSTSSQVPLHTLALTGVWAATGEPSEPWQAQVRTSAVVCTVVIDLWTLCCCCGNAIQPRLFLGQKLFCLSLQVTVHSHHSLPPPVSVIQVSSEGNQGERILDSFNDIPPQLAMRIHTLHLPCPCISPAQLLVFVVKGQTVGKCQVVFDQNNALRPIHIGHLNFRPVSVPVCPVQPPI